MQRYSGQEGGREKRNMQPWFDRRRDYFVRQLLDDFFQILHSFQELYVQYLSCWRGTDHRPDVLLDEGNQTIRRDIWEKLNTLVGTEMEKGPLWLLKDLCHRLWPESGGEQDLHGALMDWMVGSIFHEAMKLKENIYLLNSYAPAAVRMRGHQSPFPQEEGHLHPWLSQIVDVEMLIVQTAADVIRQMEQIAFLFGQTNFLLRTMLLAFRDNSLLLRFLVEQEEAVERMWGEMVEDLFGEMFDGQPAAGYCRVGRSYLDANWYSRALAMYRRALAVDSSCDEAVSRVAQLEAIVKENSEFMERDPSPVLS